MISISVYRRYAGPQWYYRQAGRSPRREPMPVQPSPQERSAQSERPPGTQRRPAQSERPPGTQGSPTPHQAPQGKSKGDLASALSGLLPEGLDSGDLFLVAMLLFLYSESHDEDFLIILIVVGISIFHKGREDK